jgi:hypothetical protein
LNSAILALEDETVFEGRSFGASAERSGEVVSKTTLAGYQELFTHPAYSSRIVILHHSQTGNYRTPAANCVTHAQLSVNPDNMRVGYRTNWASSFPFARLSLPDNYTRPLPAIVTLGFEYAPPSSNSGAKPLAVP